MLSLMISDFIKLQVGSYDMCHIWNTITDFDKDSEYYERELPKLF